MEPFSISCTTCQAKLRVRDPSVIGQILTCPKCGSMVLIEAPAHVTPTSGSAGKPSSTAEPKGPGRGQRPAPSASGLGPPARPAPEPGPPKRPDEFADTVEDPTRYGTDKTAIPPGTQKIDEPDAVTVPDFEPVENTDSGAEPDSTLDPDWLAAASRQRRRWVLAIVAMLVGISIAVAVFMYVAGRGDSTTVAQKPPQSPATSSQNQNQKTAGTSGVENSPGNDTVTSPAENKDSVAPTVTDDGKSLPPPTATPEKGVKPDSEPASPTQQNPTDPPKSDTPPNTKTPAVEVPAAEPVKPETAKGANPPLDLVPKDADRTKADKMTPGGSLSDTLRRLGGLFDDPTLPEQPTEATDPVPATPVESAAPGVPDPTKLPRPASRTINLTARLADPITAIEFSEMPLQDFFQFVTTYSTIPVTLDPEVLVWLHLTPNTPVTLKLTNTTVANLLDSAISKLGLVAVPVDDQLIVTRKAVNDGAIRKVQRKVEDLIGAAGSDAELLQSQLRKLVAPESWSERGGKGTMQIENGSLVLEQTDQVLIELSALLERLRIARGLPKTSKFEERIFQPKSRTARSAGNLQKSVTLNYSRPNSFSRIVRRLAQEAGVSILIDWHAIAAAGWNPDAETTLSVNGQPLSLALNTLLQPMDLGYRIVDETTFQITTPAALNSVADVEFYPVGDIVSGGMDPESLMKKVRESLPPETFNERDAALEFDAPSRCLLVRLPQSQQQSLEKLLGDWKK